MAPEALGKTRYRPPWHALQPAAWGMERQRLRRPEGGNRAAISKGEIDAGEPGGPEPQRRLSGGHCGAKCARSGAVGDALMRSMVRRHVTRQRNGAATAPKAEARSAMSAASGAVRVAAIAPAIGKRSEPERERGAKRARG